MNGVIFHGLAIWRYQTLLVIHGIHGFLRATGYWFSGLHPPNTARGRHTRSASLHTGCSKKTDPLICFCNNFGKCTPILILFSLLQQENYDAQNLSYFSHLTFIMLPLYLVKQTLMLYQCHYYIIIVFVYNLLHFNAFNHLHRLIWAE